MKDWEPEAAKQSGKLTDREGLYRTRGAQVRFLNKLDFTALLRGGGDDGGGEV